MWPFNRREPRSLVRYGSMDGGSKTTIHASTTIHTSGELNIEVDDDGNPVAVWFRCLNLPFTVWRRDIGQPFYFNPDDMTILNIEYKRKDAT
jgi:hypothetical protein